MILGDWLALSDLPRQDQGNRLHAAIDTALDIAALQIARDADSVREYGIGPGHRQTFWGAVAKFLEKP